MPTSTKRPAPANAFIGQPKKPTDNQLAAALGAHRKLWDQLISDLCAKNVFDQQEWNSYSPKYGWSLRLKLKKRNILYLVPYSGYFQAAVIVGDRALRTARQSGLPAKLLKIIDAAPRYPEGTGIRIDVNKSADLETVHTLAAIKLQK